MTLLSVTTVPAMRRLYAPGKPVPRVVYEQQPGYGSACLAAISALQGPDVILFIDGDHAFDAAQATGLLNCIVAGADLVIGSRTLGRQVRGALSTRPGPGQPDHLRPDPAPVGTTGN